MKNLTYNDLVALIQSMPPERRQDNVSISINLGGDDEFLPVSTHEIATDMTCALDEGHYYLVAATE
jgi:hypothetical protein